MNYKGYGVECVRASVRACVEKNKTVCHENRTVQLIVCTDDTIHNLERSVICTCSLFSCAQNTKGPFIAVTVHRWIQPYAQSNHMARLRKNRQTRSLNRSGSSGGTWSKLTRQQTPVTTKIAYACIVQRGGICLSFIHNRKKYVAQKNTFWFSENLQLVVFLIRSVRLIRNIKTILEEMRLGMESRFQVTGANIQT